MGSKKKKKLERSKRPRPPMRGRQGPQGPIVIVEPPGELKMSEVLEDFVEPYYDPERALQELTGMLHFAAMAWNAALAPQEQRDKIVQDVMQALPADDRAAIRAFLEELIQRKLELFPDIKRAILDLKLTPTPTGPHLSVMSSLEPR